MSSTELERFKKRLREAQAQLMARLQPIMGVAGVKELRGEVLGRNGLPIEGVEVITEHGLRALTDSEGRFSFKLLGAKASLTLRWRGVELIAWAEVELKIDEVTEIKVKWPHLIRGQLITGSQRGVMGARVTLNDRFEASTDLYGAFHFPLLEQERSEVNHFLFELDDERYVHHFRVMMGQSQLMLFCYQERALYHVKNLSRSAPINTTIPERQRQLSYLSLGALIGLSLLVLTALIPSVPPTPSSIPSELSLSSALSAQPSSVTGGVQSPRTATAAAQQLPRSEPSEEGEMELEETAAAESPTAPRCEQIELLYRRYRVPRGMEGFLLSILFGSWQQWKGDLDLLNGISEDKQLQAGQFIKLKLPLHEWRLFTLYPDEGAQELREALGCGEARLPQCLKLVQVWNPHLDVRFLRKGDSLLINPQALKGGRWTEDINRRLELLKRSRGKRRRRPHLSIPKGCELYPLRPEVAARVKREEQARQRALEAEREARRLERERRREQQRLEREQRRREREAKRRRTRARRRR